MAGDKSAGGQIEDQAAIHLLIEGEVEVIEGLLGVAELGLLVSIPDSASVEIKAQSLKGESDQPASNVDGVPPTDQKKSFMKPGMVSASRIVLRSFKGKIRLKRP